MDEPDDEAEPTAPVSNLGPVGTYLGWALLMATAGGAGLLYIWVGHTLLKLLGLH